MHPFSGRVCRQKEGVKKEENQEGTKERLQHRKEVRRINRMIAEGSPGRTVEPKRKTSPGCKKDIKGPRKEVLRLR